MKTDKNLSETGTQPAPKTFQDYNRQQPQRNDPQLKVTDTDTAPPEVPELDTDENEGETSPGQGSSTNNDPTKDVAPDEVKQEDSQPGAQRNGQSPDSQNVS